MIYNKANLQKKRAGDSAVSSLITWLRKTEFDQAQSEIMKIRYIGLILQ
ncbi:MAG: hypothetical protein K9K63_15520 [Desulfotignum sp.]|nr:hypothetical protein [Desulfotignum sp.]MCF8138712.1 hypothetical protein [Desulfotignum sp.]